MKKKRWTRALDGSGGPSGPAFDDSEFPGLFVILEG